MSRFRKLILFAAVTAIITGAGLALTSLHLSDVQAASKQEDKFRALETFSQSLSLIENNYVEPVNSTKLIYDAIGGMLNGLDPHSTFFTPDQFKKFSEDMKGEFGGLGITIGSRDNNLTVIAPIEDTPAYAAGLQSGDIIAKIDGATTSGISIEEAVSRLRGKPGTKVTITIYRKGVEKPFDVTITRAIIKVKSVKSRMIDNIAYLRLTEFKENAGAELRDALKKLDESKPEGIILDLRNDPGGSLDEAVNVASLFLPSGKTVVFTRDRAGKETHLKTHAFTYRDETRPMMVIVNEGSASASEIVAGALQDYKRAVVLGQTTFGKASVQSVIPMGDGSALKLTTARYYTPKGRSIQNEGIKPDIPVAQGKIVLAEKGEIVKEKDLDGHLTGSNDNKGAAPAAGAEKKDETKEGAEGDISTDLQLQFTVNMLKGFITYGVKK